MANLHNALLIGFPWLAFACAACAGPEGGPVSQGDKTSIVHYRAECSQVTPRAAVLRVRWPKAVRLGEERIQISIYKDGFRTKRFVSVAAVDPRAVPKSGLAMRPPPGPMANVNLPEALSLRLESLRTVSKGTEIDAVVAGLVPGINYYLSVEGVSDETFRVRAPICPADFVEPPRTSPK